MAQPALDRQGTKTWVVQKTDDIRKYYTLGKALGQPGQFGYALLAKHNKTGEDRAVKVINKARFSRTSDRNYHFEQLRGEIEVMKRMQHANIIRMFEVFEDQKELFIVMELCTGGELFDRIKAQGQYTELDASKVLRQICEGLKYMHGNKVAHCDLKPDNFLFLTTARDSPIKIIDFGMSKFVKRRKYFEALCGTPYYVAPEVIRGHYSEHCDIWSLGVVMFVMLFGYPPFYAEKDEQIFALVCNGFAPVTKDGYGAHFPKAIPCSDAAKDLMAKMLTLDTAKRITAAEALEHPWLTGEKATNKPMVSTVLTNLKNFSGTSRFKQAILQMMSNSLTESELEELKRTFSAIDANGDGVITVAEMKNAVEKWGGETKSQEMLMQLMKNADVNGDGCLSWQEIVLTCVQRKLNAKEERLWDAFCKLDLNGDGRVTKEEIEQVLGASNARDLIAEADVNHDGTIDYDEFITMWSAQEATK